MQKETLSIMIVKTILAVVIFAGIGTIIIGGAYLIGKDYKNETDNKISEPANQEIENCAKIGESVGSCVGCKKCCQGLQPMDYLKYNSECVNSPMPGGGVCSNCGNGICDDENNEDECNCPEDCGEIKIPDWAIYKSEKLGIMFKYPAWWKNLPEKNFKDTIVEKNNTIKSTAMQGSSITVFEKSENETIEKAIEKIIKKEGVDLENCRIIAKKQNIPKDSNDINISISLKEDYEPSDDEIMTKIGNIDSLEDLDVICKTTPECEWVKQILIEKKTKTKCSQYAKCFGYKCGSNFIYQPNNSKERFIYIQSMASTPHFWEWNSIEILKDQPDISDWQTYRNEEFGFEVKYPEEWKMKEKIGKMSPSENKLKIIEFLPVQERILGKDSEGHSLIYPGVYVYVSTVDWETELNDFNFRLKGKSTDIVIDNITGVRREGKITEHLPPYGSDRVEAILNKSSKPYVVSAFDYDKNIFNQMLSTFKFIEK